MDIRVLVAYASKYGATAEIAKKLGKILSGAGLKVDVLPVDSVAGLEPYQAVVLGSAVYAGRWRKEAASFLTSKAPALGRLPLWLFSSGPTGDGDPSQLVKGWRFPKALESLADSLQPRDIALFHGVLDLGKLNVAEKLIIKGVKAPLGDYRDWEAVDRWATGIVEALKREVADPIR
jgi:menaquinone-dependent protoporphyrinogen oxidase